MSAENFLEHDDATLKNYSLVTSIELFLNNFWKAIRALYSFMVLRLREY